MTQADAILEAAAAAGVAAGPNLKKSLKQGEGRADSELFPFLILRRKNLKGRRGYYDDPDDAAVSPY